MHSSNDPCEGPGAGPASSGVEPGAPTEPEAAPESGEVEVPLGTPASEEEWRELKRCADEPDPHAEEDPPPSG